MKFQSQRKNSEGTGEPPSDHNPKRQQGTSVDFLRLETHAARHQYASRVGAYSQLAVPFSRSTLPAKSWSPSLPPAAANRTLSRFARWRIVLEGVFHFAGLARFPVGLESYIRGTLLGERHRFS